MQNNLLYAPYSFSKIQLFFECQKKFEFTYIKKIDIDNEYIDPLYFKRGRFLHAYMSDRLNGGNRPSLTKYNIDIEDKLKLIENADTALQNEYITLTYNFNINKIEKYISLNNKLEPLKSNEQTIMKGYIDYFAVQNDIAVIVDWKTGKSKKTPHFFQLEIYAIWLLQIYPEILEIDLLIYYIEQQKFMIKTITANDIQLFKKDLFEKINLIENTTLFNANKTPKCNDCPFFLQCN